MIESIEIQREYLNQVGELKTRSELEALIPMGGCLTAFDAMNTEHGDLGRTLKASEYKGFYKRGTMLVEPINVDGSPVLEQNEKTGELEQVYYWQTPRNRR
jgi:hypothetical protein